MEVEDVVHPDPRRDRRRCRDFPQLPPGWTIEIRNTLNRGVLPDGDFAMADQRVSGPEPDVIALRLCGPEPSGGLAVADTPPRIVPLEETDRASWEVSLRPIRDLVGTPADEERQAM
jgi:hypothetical protein